MLAWILKYTLEEFGDDEIPEIMNHLSLPVISSIRMEQGQTNWDKIEKQSEEDMVIGEGKIYYDIRFSAYHGEEQIKILVNIEAQQSTSPSKLFSEIIIKFEFHLWSDRSTDFRLECSTKR